MPKRKFDDGATNSENAEAAPAATSSSSARADTLGPTRVKAACLDVSALSNGAGSSSGQKRRVRFDGVTVFYFERSQGFSCVPSFGGTTLGMTQRHHATKKFSLAEHEQALRDQQSQSQQKLAKSTNGNPPTTTQQVTTITAETTAEEESDESDEEDAVEGEEDGGLAGADAEEEEYFLQPLAGRDRRLLLKSAGVTVDKDERVECQAIRVSRQTCGCSCQGSCLPETCECARDHVKCQVDRPSFPCGCSSNTCGNPEGRVEFNALRVRTHYVQTMMRLRLEQQARFRGAAVPSPTHFHFDDDGSTYCSPPPPAIYDQQPQRSLCNGTGIGLNGTAIGPTFPALHTFFYPQHPSSTPTTSTMAVNGFHHHPTMHQLSSQLSLNSSGSSSVDSGFDESPSTPLPLAALYAHQRQRAEGATCAPETAIEAPSTQTLEETTAAS